MRTHYTKCKIYQPNLNQLQYTLMFNKLHCKLNINTNNNSKVAQKTCTSLLSKLNLTNDTLSPAFPQSSVPSIARIQDKDLLFNFVKTSKYVHHSDTSLFNDAITNIALHWRSRNCGILFLKIR